MSSALLCLSQAKLLLSWIRTTNSPSRSVSLIAVPIALGDIKCVRPLRPPVLIPFLGRLPPEFCRRELIQCLRDCDESETQIQDGAERAFNSNTETLLMDESAAEVIVYDACLDSCFSNYRTCKAPIQIILTL